MMLLKVLLLKFKLGLFDDPYGYSNEQRESELVGKEQHLNLAEEAALKSIVLLKNENEVLPLDKIKISSYRSFSSR